MQFLNSFETTEDIYEYLQVQEIKAICGNPWQCAIAKYITDSMGITNQMTSAGGLISSAEQVIVQPGSIEYAIGDDLLVSMFPSEQVMRFIAHFDAELYTDLMR